MNSGSVLTLDLGQILGLSGSGAIYTSSGEFCFQPVGTQNLLLPIAGSHNMPEVFRGNPGLFKHKIDHIFS